MVIFASVDPLIENVTKFFDVIISGVSGFVGGIVVDLINFMLFFPPPDELTAAATSLSDLYWGVSFPLYFFLLSAIIPAYFGLMQLFPEADEADLDRFMKRVFFATVLVIIMGEMFNYGVTFVNIIGESLYPESMRIAVNIGSIEGIATIAFAGLSVIIFAIIASPAIVITYILFLIMLAMRGVIIYSTYTLFPVLMAFWIGDIGPLKYGKMVSSILFKACALLLLFGILLSAILGVGGALAGEDVTNATSPGGTPTVNMTGTTVDGSRDGGGILSDRNPSFAAGDRGQITQGLIGVFSYFASIWLCITITSMILGGTTSVGFRNKVKKGQKWGSGGKKLQDRVKERAENSDNTLSDKVEDAIDKIEDVQEKPEKARNTVKEEIEAQQKAYDNSGSIDDVVEEGKGFYEDKVRDKVDDAMDKTEEVASDAGDKVEEGAEELGSVGGEAGAAAGKAAGKAANMGVTAAGKAAGETGKVAERGVSAAASKGMDAAMKSGNLAARGGSAYWEVFKQPDAGSSIGRMKGIARTSPIGKPSEPDESGAIDADDLTVDDLDVESHVDAHGHDVNSDSKEKSGGE